MTTDLADILAHEHALWRMTKETVGHALAPQLVFFDDNGRRLAMAAGPGDDLEDGLVIAAASGLTLAVNADASADSLDVLTTVLWNHQPAGTVTTLYGRTLWGDWWFAEPEFDTFHPDATFEALAIGERLWALQWEGDGDLDETLVMLHLTGWECVTLRYEDEPA